MTRSLFIRVLGAGGLLWLGGGCWANNRINDALAYNRALAEHWDKQLFLNAVRASRRQPMYFTAVTQATETFTYSVQAGPGVSYKGADANPWSATLPITLSYSPSSTLTLQPLDTEKFMKGIERPIDLDIFRLFWEAGWPREMLLHLFVRTFVLDIPKEEDLRDSLQKLTPSQRQELSYSLVSPNDYATVGADDVGAIVDSARKWLKRFGFELGQRYWREGLLDEVAEARGVSSADKDILNDEEQEISDVNEPKLAQKLRQERDVLRKKYPLFWRYKRFVHGLSAALLKGEDKYVGDVPPLYFEWINKSQMQIGPAVDVGVASKADFLALAQKEGYSIEKDEAPDKYKLMTTDKALKVVMRPHAEPAQTVLLLGGQIKMRSPEAILYYLGEIVRFCNDHVQDDLVPVRLYPRGAPGYLPLFVARLKKADDRDPALLVRHEDGDYVIPGGGRESSGESMHTLSLVSQLVLLYKSSDSLPPPGVFTLIGK
jgi:hypothetical protein